MHLVVISIPHDNVTKYSSRCTNTEVKLYHYTEHAQIEVSKTNSLSESMHKYRNIKNINIYSCD